MFESVLFRRQSNLPNESPIDIGSLIEAMIFYGRTTLVVDREILGYVLHTFGINAFIEFLSEGLLSVSYTETMSGIRTETDAGGHQLHDPVILSSPQHSFPDELRKICIEIVGKDGKGRRLARRIEPLIKVVHHDNMTADGARTSILDERYLKSATEHILSALIPNTSFDGIEFMAEPVDGRLRIHSNLNFVALNQAYHQLIPPTHSSITPAYLLNHLFDAECDLYFASMHLSEMVTRPLNTGLLSHRLNYLIQRRAQSEANVSRFQSIVFADARAVAAAVRDGNASPSDFLPVLKHSQRFKSWLSSKPYDADLLAEYYKAITSKSLVEKLPGKSARFAIFTGAGITADFLVPSGLGTAAGVALGALDTFVMDNFLKGWNPSQFIEDDLRPLLRK